MHAPAGLYLPVASAGAAADDAARSKDCGKVPVMDVPDVRVTSPAVSLAFHHVRHEDGRMVGDGSNKWGAVVQLNGSDSA